MRPLSKMNLDTFYGFRQPFSFVMVILCALTQVWICESVVKNFLPAPEYDSADYVTVAYNMAKYNVSSISKLDSANVTPDIAREPVTGLLLSLPMRVMEVGNLECLLAQQVDTCKEQLRWVTRINTIQVVFITIGVFIAVFKLTSSYLLSNAAVLLISSSVLLPSFVKVFSSEIPAANFLLWHSILLWGAFFSKHRRVCATGSGILLLALILTKAVYVYWMYLLCVCLILSWIYKSRINKSITFTLLLIVTPAFIGIGGWMARNYYYLDRLTLTDRANSVIAIRTNYTKISWEQYSSGYLYFIPYYGPEIAKKYFGDIPENTYDDNKPGWVEKHMLPAFPPNFQSLSESDILLHFGQAMLQNLDKHLALIPLFIYRGMFVGPCCTVEGNYIMDPPFVSRPIQLFWLAQKLITALLGPIFFLSIFLIIRKKNWGLLLFFSPVLFNFLIHSAFTQFYSRFSIPVYPMMLIALFVCFDLYRQKNFNGIPSIP